VCINSFKEKSDIIRNPMAIIGEQGFRIANYIEAMEKMNYFQAFGNSLIITIFSVTLIVVLSSMTAYLFARTDWKICKFIFSLMIISMVIPFQVLMIPIVSIYGASLNILNSKITLIFMHVGFGVSMGMFLFHGAIKSTIPIEMEEAARIDGCGKTKTFFRIVFPLLKPTCATLIVIDALAIWNDYLLPSLVLGKKNLYTLPITARVFHGTYSSDYGLMMAGLILSVLPILILYVVLQKNIIEGVVSGAVKG
jgi:raffinose/stachyose/melibiose transport system permease protein